MKIFSLAFNGIKPATAVARYKYNKNKQPNKPEELRYCIQHGTHGKNTWCAEFYLTELLLPNSKEDKLELKDNQFTLKVIRDKNTGKPILDKFKNKVYTISINKESLVLDTDQIVFWNIPIGIYTDVKYTISGSVVELCKGINGKFILDQFYTSPAPVLNVFGSCELCWSAVDKRKNKHYSQHISYNETTGWKVETIVTKDITEG